MDALPNWLSKETEKHESRFERAARSRIDKMNFSETELNFIWSDWPNWDEHIRWLMTASRDEIQSWIDVSA
jgi:hypothetical protein